VAAVREPNELLRFVRQRKKAFAEDDRDRGVARAVHDQERSVDPRNPLVGMERILIAKRTGNGNADAATSASDVYGASRMSLPTGCAAASATATPCRAAARR
jgi:hypothetical protein